MTTPSRTKQPQTKPGAKSGLPPITYWPLILAAAALIASVLHHLVAGIHGKTPQQNQALDKARHYLGLATPALLITAAAIAVLVFLARRLGLSHRTPGDRETRVLSAAGNALHVDPRALHLTRAKWQRRRILTHGRLAYPAGDVIADQSDTLAKALAPFAVTPLTVTWDAHRNRFDLAPGEAAPARLEQFYPALHKLLDTLTFILGGEVTADQAKSRIDPDSGAVETLVAHYGLTTRDLGDGFRERVQAVLDRKSPSPTGYWSIRWQPEAATVTVTPAAPLPRLADYPTPAALTSRTVLPVGVGDGGQIATWDPTRQPHMLISGATGGGKTSTINTLVIGAIAAGWDTLLIDPKELSFRGHGDLPGVRMLATTEAESEQAIDVAYRTLRNRYAALKAFAVREQDLRPLLVVVDEASELVERLNAYHATAEKQRDRGLTSKPTGTRNPELLKLWSLLRLGRQAGVYLVIGLQRADVSFIPGEARLNCRSRLALGPHDGAGLEMMFDSRSVRQRVTELATDPHTGHTRMQIVRGRGTYGALGAGTDAIQTFWVPDPAQLRTGELNTTDTERIRHYIHWATSQRAALGVDDTHALGDDELRQAAIAAAGAAAITDRDTELDADLALGSSDIPTALDRSDLSQLPTIRAQQLRDGMTVAIDVDGTPTLAEISEVAPDPIDDTLLEITYRIVGDHPAAGQAGVTTYEAAEAVHILDDTPADA